jgi:ABC-type phosphate transport system permease subunit
MSKNKHDKFGGAIAIYYGIGSFVFGLISLTFLGRWFYQVFRGQSEFTWITPIGLLLLSVFAFGLGYILYRTGTEQMED